MTFRQSGIERSSSGDENRRSVGTRIPSGARSLGLLTPRVVFLRVLLGGPWWWQGAVGSGWVVGGGWENASFPTTPFFRIKSLRHQLFWLARRGLRNKYTINCFYELQHCNVAGAFLGQSVYEQFVFCVIPAVSKDSGGR